MQISRRLPFPSENSANPLTQSRQVLTEISSLVCGSKVYWRGRSFTAKVPSDISKVQKGQKRVSKDERHAMVESFVNKYRATNAGQFPSASETRKQVGGGYYVIRKIVQELEYISKISSMKTRKDNVLGKETAKVNEESTAVDEVSGSRPRMDSGIHRNAKTAAGYDVACGDPGTKSVEADKGHETSTLFEMTMSNEDDYSSYIEKRRHIPEGEAEVDFHLCSEKLEHDVKETSHSDGVLDLDGPKAKSKQHQESPESDKFVRHVSEKHIDDREPPKKSSLWGNLKSLADGIINMWTKQ